MLVVRQRGKSYTAGGVVSVTAEDDDQISYRQYFKRFFILHPRAVQFKRYIGNSALGRYCLDSSYIRRKKVLPKAKSPGRVPLAASKDSLPRCDALVPGLC